MENEYVKLLLKYEEYFKTFSDAEVGRLARAMISYKSSGAEPKFSGNERFLWPVLKQDIDFSVAKQQELSQTRADCGRLGGRPLKANAFPENQNNQKVFDESKKSYKNKSQDKSQSKSKEKDIDFSPSGEKTRTRFTPPTVEEVEAYIRERQSNIDAQHFVDYYAARGWVYKTGQKMKDWRAAVRTWEQRDGTETQAQTVASSAPDAGELERMRKLRERLKGDVP